MSEEEAAPMEVTEEVEVVEEAPMDVMDALKVVLKKALIFDGLRRGLHECAKALDRGAARLCILADDCDNQEYKSLVQALCSENNVHVIMADAGTDLAEWVGLAKLNADGTVRKVKKCSVAVVTDFGEESRELSIVLNHVREQA